MDGLKEKILNTYESKLKKGVKYFTKKLEKLKKQNNSFNIWQATKKGGGKYREIKKKRLDKKKNDILQFSVSNEHPVA